MEQKLQRCVLVELESMRGAVELRQIVERAYVADPSATDSNLRRLKLDDWIAELRIDAATGRLRDNVESVASPGYAAMPVRVGRIRPLDT